MARPPLHAVLTAPATLTDHLTTQLMRSAAVSSDAALAAVSRAITGPLTAGTLPEPDPLAAAYLRTAHAALAQHVASNIRAWAGGKLGDAASTEIGLTAVDAWILTTPGAGRNDGWGPQLRAAAARVRALIEQVQREWDRGELRGAPGYDDELYGA